MLSFVLIIFLTILLAHYLYIWATKNNDYFIKRGICQMKPVFLVGNNGGAFLGKYTVPEFAKHIYSQFPGEK